MVLLTLTELAKAAVDEYCKLQRLADENNDNVEKLSQIQLGSPIDHNDLVGISKYLVEKQQENVFESGSKREWRLDSLLKGAFVFEPPSTPKPEPVSLMKKILEDNNGR